MGIFSERLTPDTSWQDFSLWFFCRISLAMVKTAVKNVLWRAFPDLACHFFLFLFLCHLLARCYCLVWFLKRKVAHCVLSFWLVYVMLRSYMLMPFQYLWISSQIEPDVALCYHCMQTLELFQTKDSMSSHSVRFSSGVLNLSSNE